MCPAPPVPPRWHLTTDTRRSDVGASSWRGPEVASASGSDTILTTIEPCPEWLATVRPCFVCGLTCEDERRRTRSNPLPSPGGQGVAGSNPVSPTTESAGQSGCPSSGAAPALCFYRNRNRNAVPHRNGHQCRASSNWSAASRCCTGATWRQRSAVIARTSGQGVPARPWCASRRRAGSWRLSAGSVQVDPGEPGPLGKRLEPGVGRSAVPAACQSRM